MASLSFSKKRKKLLLSFFSSVCLCGGDRPFRELSFLNHYEIMTQTEKRCRQSRGLQEREKLERTVGVSKTFRGNHNSESVVTESLKKKVSLDLCDGRSTQVKATK